MTLKEGGADVPTGRVLTVACHSLVWQVRGTIAHKSARTPSGSLTLDMVAKAGAEASPLPMPESCRSRRQSRSLAPSSHTITMMMKMTKRAEERRSGMTGKKHQRRRPAALTYTTSSIQPSTFNTWCLLSFQIHPTSIIILTPSLLH
ncbi:uncharacterized protein LY79DRAFT_570511 [Colletotrichum navitas]|uniref:Uncharacterized protein n=1 Tax=Colletotrichum navitas TaxID=681940 RepID=A0AAD8PLT0_9PEZI|nr:uncharacterized protein LY79DRAFT_570511 [Colletotrichum navitas]KAK1570089.1 hypothetical protein LY79DRAFT_570511 [Colletotrichum navitas]